MMIYKSFKEIPYTEKKLFIKSFASMKSKKNYTTSNIKKIQGYAKSEKIESIYFAINYFSIKDKQTVQSSWYKATDEEYDKIKREEKKRILNKKIKKISLS